MMRTCLLALGIWASVIMPCSAQAQDDGQADARGIERTSKQTFAEVKDLPADLKPPVFDGATATVSGVGYFSAPNGGAKQSFPIVDRDGLHAVQN